MHSKDIDDLCLDFTFPGYPKLELIPRGRKISVTKKNIGEYLEKVLDSILGQGITEQVLAFRSGFNIVFPISDLLIFNDAEKVDLMGGSITEDWSFASILFIYNTN